MSNTTRIASEPDRNEENSTPASLPTLRTPRAPSLADNARVAQSLGISSRSGEMKIERDGITAPVIGGAPDATNGSGGSNLVGISPLTNACDPDNPVPSAANPSAKLLRAQGENFSLHSATNHSVRAKNTRLTQSRQVSESLPSERRGKIRRLNNVQPHQIGEQGQRQTSFPASVQKSRQDDQARRLPLRKSAHVTQPVGNPNAVLGFPESQQTASSADVCPTNRAFEIRPMIAFQSSASPQPAAGTVSQGQGSTHHAHSSYVVGAESFPNAAANALRPSDSIPEHVRDSQQRGETLRAPGGRLSMQSEPLHVRSFVRPRFRTASAMLQPTTPEHPRGDGRQQGTTANSPSAPHFPQVLGQNTTVRPSSCSPAPNREVNSSSPYPGTSGTATFGNREQEYPALQNRPSERIGQRNVWIMRWHLMIANGQPSEVIEEASEQPLMTDLERLTARNTRINSNPTRFEGHRVPAAGRHRSSRIRDLLPRDETPRRPIHHARADFRGRGNAERELRPFARPRAREIMNSLSRRSENNYWDESSENHRPHNSTHNGSGQGNPVNVDPSDTDPRDYVPVSSTSGVDSDSSIRPQYDETRPSEAASQHWTDNDEAYWADSPGLVLPGHTNREAYGRARTSSRIQRSRRAQVSRRNRNFVRTRVLEIRPEGSVNDVVRSSVASGDERVRREIAAIVGCPPEQLNERLTDSGIDELSGMQIARILRVVYAGHHERRKAASRQVIDAIPTEVATEADVEIRCVICLCDVEVGETLKKLPCTHKYHARCIDEWLSRNGCCPVDKRRVD